eukprot:CAMPEP_0179021420 /NCGR_PEP_ID=MMETSP0796-20121207/5878_1 /TAXON_ID=73915 /ORGANISM="Pyrodinium bahamense, Strain pbaha01" /LENGTH=336 /DNA_ID=CAMNT_0020717245 /DNA_START=68 /DNA_END=1078 /DNA_ORIENTATION=+
MVASAGFVRALAECGIGVGLFLSIEDLLVAEQAKVLTYDEITYLWEIMATSAMSEVPPLWGGTATAAFESLSQLSENGKALVRELCCLRKSLFLPTAWVAGIRQSSSCSLQALPRALHADRADGTPTQLAGPGANGGRQYRDDHVPLQASAAVAVGARSGNALAAGVKVHCDGHIGEGFSLGVEAIVLDGYIFSVEFFPISGRCCVSNPNLPRLTAQVLPALDEAECGSPDAGQSMDVWVKVTEQCGVFFLRHIHGRPLEESGLLPPSIFPLEDVAEFFAALNIYRAELEAPLSAAVIHADFDFPRGLLRQDAPTFGLDAAWHREHEDLEAGSNSD